MKKLFSLNILTALALLFGAFTTNASAGLCGSSTNPNNTCIGSFSGSQVTTGTNNSFFGRSAGQNESAGQSNSYFGSLSGFKSSGSQRNSFFGAFSGTRTLGSNNAFFGTQAGANNEMGAFNTFVGDYSGFTNESGTFNSLFGRGTDLASPGLNYATAIGAGAIVTASNTIQLGRDGFTVTRLAKLGTGGSTALCLNGDKEISTCSVSALTSSSQVEIDDLEETLSEQKKEIRSLQGQIESLKNTICSTNRRAAVCR